MNGPGFTAASIRRAHRVPLRDRWAAARCIAGSEVSCRLRVFPRVGCAGEARYRIGGSVASARLPGDDRSRVDGGTASRCRKWVVCMSIASAAFDVPGSAVQDWSDRVDLNRSLPRTTAMWDVCAIATVGIGCRA